MRPNNRKLLVESLEKREMMAGDLRVTLSQGTLTILGDQARNEVEVVAGANGTLTIRGHVLGGGSTTLNGRNQTLTATGVRNLQIGLGGGNDIIRFGDASGRITKTAGTTILDAGAGSDEIYVRNVEVGGELHVNTGTGAHDVANVVGSTIGGNMVIGDPLAVNRGDWDEINVIGTTCRRQMSFLTRTGNDRVGITNSAADSIFADLGAGNDSFSMTYTSHGRTFDVRGGGGYDTFFVPIYRNTKYSGSGFEKVTNHYAV